MEAAKLKNFMCYSWNTGKLNFVLTKENSSNFL